MRRSTTSRPRFRRAIALCGVAFLASCGADNPTPAPSEVVSLHLAERLAAADLYRTGPPTNLCGADAGAFLTAGWHDQTPGDREAGLRWTSGRNAVVDIPVVTPDDFRLELDLEALVDRSPHLRRAAQRISLPPLRLQLLWNGERLEEATLRPGAGLRLELPGTLQRVGTNRLEIQPQHWLGPAAHQRLGDRRVLGVGCRRITVSNAATRRGGAAARGKDIVQSIDSVASFGFATRDNARLRGSVMLPAAASVREAPRVSVRLQTREGTRIRVGPTPVPSEGALPIDVDLSDVAGQVVSLDLSVQGSSTPMDVEWKGLRIESAAHAHGDPHRLPRRSYNVFVLLLDSLRADHIEPYAGVDARTPGFQRIASEGTTFSAARSNASWTRMAVASLLSSLLAPGHGVVENDERLPTGVPVLPELLQQRGYRTVGVTANPTVSKTFGFSRGFGALHPHYRRTQNPVWRSKHATPEERARFVWDSYLAPIVEAEVETPFFIYLHEIDPHSPFTPEPPYDELADTGYRGTFDFDLPTLARIHADPSWVEPEDMRHANARYRGEIRFMDRYVAWMLDRLDAVGLGNETLFILTSDHGEEFLDHGSVGHGHSVYDELLRVPLLMRLPGVLPAGRRVEADAQLIDLPPTVLDLIGEAVPEWMQGVSLLDAVSADGVDSHRAIVSFAGGAGRDSVKLGPWKLIREHASDGGVVRHQLFDIASDPEESNDLWAQELIVGQAARQALRREIESSRRAEFRETDSVQPDEVDADVVEGLRALGYLE